MDASIAAAWIGAGVGGGVALIGVVGTVVTSIVSSNNTRKATERTVDAGTDANRATLIAARDDRLWEQRCAVYEEMLVEFQQHEETLEFELMTFNWKTMTGLSSENPIVPQDPRGWPGVRARLVAYATDKVLAAYEAASSAETAVKATRIAFSSQLYENREAGDAWYATDAPGASALNALGEELKRVRAAFEDAKARLVAVIREELRSRPEAAMPPAEVPVPAPRRSILPWRRQALPPDGQRPVPRPPRVPPPS